MDAPKAGQVDHIAEFVTRFRTLATSALDQFGQRVTNDIRERLSIQYPPASLPGEDPHKRTGRLREGIHHEIESSAEGLAMSVLSERSGGNPNVPLFLNEGTSKMKPRPYAQMTRDKWEPVVFDLITDSIRQSMLE